MTSRVGALLRAAGMVLGITLLLGIGAWVLANTVFRPAPPKPLWTVSDLPALPPAKDNGFVGFEVHVSRTPLPPVPDAVRHILDPGSATGADRLALAQARRRTFSTLLASAGPALSLFSAMARAPAFADACDFSPRTHCPVLQLLHLHRVVEVAAMSAAVDGRRAAAMNTAADLLTVDERFARSARTVLSLLIATVDLQRSFSLADLVLAVPDPKGARAAAEAHALARLGRRLAAERPGLVDPRRGVIGEYLQVVADIHYVAKARLARLHHRFGPLARLFFDPGASLRIVAPYFRGLMALAKDPRAPRPTPPTHPRTRRLWWASNAGGKLLVEVATPDLAPALVRLHKATRVLDAEAERVRKRYRQRRPHGGLTPAGP